MFPRTDTYVNKTQKTQKAFTTPNEERRENLFSWRPSDGGAKPQRGFTLIELMVAVSIFAIVMLVGVGAMVSLVQANKRAQAINSVMNNLNAAIESMSRSIRVGTTYYCGPLTTAAIMATPLDCAGSGADLLAFESSKGNDTLDSDQVIYRLHGNQIERSLASGANGTWVALTAPEVSIETLKFYVIGSSRGDTVQPRVLMLIKGSAQVPGGTTTFTVQSSVVQRLIDL